MAQLHISSSFTRRTAASVACAALVALAGTRIAAHDFWIEPSLYQGPVGSMLGLALRVGQDFHGDAVPRNPALIERFVVAGPDGLQDVGGQNNVDPAGVLTFKTPGTYVVGYRSKPSSVELDGTKFEAYLKEEGLEAIIDQRAKAGRSQAPGIEIFSRCAKTIIVSQPAVGASNSGTAGSGAATPAMTATAAAAAAANVPPGGFDRALGLRLELIPETNPYARTSDAMTFRLLYEGQPLANALVVAIPSLPMTPEMRIQRAQQQTPVALLPASLKPSVRTDAAGRATLKLTKGVWLIKAVHMVPAPKGVAAEWESLWASVTFDAAEVRKPTSRRGPQTQSQNQRPSSPPQVDRRSAADAPPSGRVSQAARARR
jgi:hypothetical protein